MINNVIAFPSERIKRGPREIREADVVTFPIVPSPQELDLAQVDYGIIQDFFTQLMMPSDPDMLDYDGPETVEGVVIFDYDLFRPEDNKK